MATTSFYCLRKSPRVKTLCQMSLEVAHILMGFALQDRCSLHIVKRYLHCAEELMFKQVEVE